MNNCEVSESNLRKRLAAGESYEKARKLRNFNVFGRKYKSLWDLAKDTEPLLTYHQLRYRVVVLKMTPTEAVKCVFSCVESKRATGKGDRGSRGTRLLSEGIEQRVKTQRTLRRKRLC